MKKLSLIKIFVNIPYLNNIIKRFESSKFREKSNNLINIEN